MYQHDVQDAKLKKNLEEVMIESVSFVGVDLNRAPVHVLRRVAGLGPATANAIVERRTKLGQAGFSSREDLRKVKGVGAAAFRQCAGFVRIFDESRDEPLDALMIHPESYDLAKKLICKEGFEARRDLGREVFRRRFQTLTKDQDQARKISAES